MAQWPGSADHDSTDYAGGWPAVGEHRPFPTFRAWGHAIGRTGAKTQEAGRKQPKTETKLPSASGKSGRVLGAAGSAAAVFDGRGKLVVGRQQGLRVRSAVAANERRRPEMPRKTPL
jgi:hypothetical protein